MLLISSIGRVCKTSLAFSSFYYSFQNIRRIDGLQRLCVLYIKYKEEFIIEELLKEIFSDFEQQDIEDAEEILNILKFDNIKSSPEDFNYLYSGKFESIMMAMVKKLYPEIDDYNKLSKVMFIFLHYDFMEKLIQNTLLYKVKSTTCIYDKSRKIISDYLNMLLEKQEEVPDYSIEDISNPKFGSYQQWMDLCAGINELFYGNQIAYLKALRVLTDKNNVVRKYKHKKIDMYILTFDGKEIYIESYYDEIKEIKLVDKGSYYIVRDNIAEKVGYLEPYIPKDKTEKIFLRRHFMLPKSQILKRFYKESEVEI